jgi:hypothetical protein
MTREPLTLPGILRSARAEEAGYAMLTVTLLILIFATAISSYSFVFKRNLEYDMNFSAGQRLAEAALFAHSLAQTIYFDPASIGISSCTRPATPPTSDCTANGGLLGPWFCAPAISSYCRIEAQAIPVTGNAYLKLTNIGKIALTLDVRGMERSPPFGIAHRAPSAYLHLKIRPPAGQQRRPADQAAFLAGANKNGLKRVGFVGQHNAGNMCGGQATVVRWGAEAVDCLNQTQITSLGFTDVQDDDVIIPAWETALNPSNDESTLALMRYPQPMRPDKQIMSKHLTMGLTEDASPRKTSVLGINKLNTDTMLADTEANFTGTVLVRQGETTTLNGMAQTNDDFTVSAVNRTPSSSAPSMTVSGVVTLTDSTISVANTLKKGTGTLRIFAENPVFAERVGLIAGGGENTVIDRTLVDPLNPASAESTTPTTVAVDDVSGNPITSLDVTNGNWSISGHTLDGGGAEVPNSLNTTTTTIRPVGAKMDVYAAQVTTHKTGSNPADTGGRIVSNQWDIGSIDQSGNTPTRYLKVNEIVQVDDKCFGRACPDSIVEPPEDPPLE